MKILLSGYHNPHFVTVTEYIERAVRLLGHDLITFDDRRHLFPGRLRQKFRILQQASVGLINRRLVRLAEGSQPDAVIVTGGHRITRACLKRLRQHQLRTALWTIDAPQSSDLMMKTAFDYHYLFCQGSEYVDIFTQMGLAQAEWLPMACDPEVHRPVEVSGDEKLKFGSDVVFVGSYYRQRAEMLEAVLRHHPALWGPGWDVLPPTSPLRACIRGAHTQPDIWTKIYSASKIVLSIHYCDSENRFPVHQASPRVFEAMACGAFVLTDRQKDVLSLFKDGAHLVAFSDAADLDRKIAYYLGHADEREQIAAAGRQEVLKNHTYGHRIQSLLARMGATVTPPAPLPAPTSPATHQHIAA
jgi:spore maturation protein CgeB